MNRSVAADSKGLALAADLLRAGGVVAFPTETYYGLAVDPFNQQALDRLFAVKRRPYRLPILVLVSDCGQLPLLIDDLPAMYHHLIKWFWPGPLTLVCPALPELPPQLTGNTRTIGVRRSSGMTATALVAAFGSPITATSANIHGFPAAVSAREVKRIFAGEIDLIVDGGNTPGGAGSTLIKLEQGTLRCIREGKIPFAAVQEAAAFFARKQCMKIGGGKTMADIQWNKTFALAQTTGDEDLLKELLDLFRLSATNDYTRLLEAVANNDTTTIMYAAHSLKGAAATLGFEGICQLAGEMENDARQHSINVTREKIGIMADLLAQLENL